MDCSLPGSSVHGILQARKNDGVDNHSLRDSLVAQLVKNLPANAEDVGSILGQKIPVIGNATHSSIFAWKIPWTEESGRLQSMGLQRVRHD